MNQFNPFLLPDIDLNNSKLNYNFEDNLGFRSNSNFDSKFSSLEPFKPNNK